ncbi:MAG: hypothetical protein IJ308_03595 [Clostridia bacterium]|nr:hypothetical protein [Clostridia bacterium]
MTYFVTGKTCEEINGKPEESDVTFGPFDTYEKAAYQRDVLDEERWISGQHVYYDLHVKCYGDGQ